MKRIKIYGLVLGLFTLLGVGCGTPIMRDTTTIHQPSPEYALVVFVRPTAFGGGIKFGLWDGDQLIGILNAKRIVQYKATPGEHLFLARAENWSYLKANLEAGKRYIVVGKVYPGVWKARVGLSPVTKSSDTDQATIDGWLASGTPSEVIPEQYESYQTPRQPQVNEAIAEFEAGEVEFEVLEADDHR